MGCNCNRKIKKVKNIAKGFTSLVVESISGKEIMKTEKYNERIELCRKCPKMILKGMNSLWCSDCGCLIIAKARVEDEVCPKGFWEITLDNKMFDENKMEKK